MPEQPIAPWVPERLARLRRSLVELKARRETLTEASDGNRRAIEETETAIKEIEAKL